MGRHFIEQMSWDEKRRPGALPLERIPGAREHPSVPGKHLQQHPRFPRPAQRLRFSSRERSVS